MDPKSENDWYIPGPGFPFCFFVASSNMVFRLPFENTLFPQLTYFDSVTHPLSLHILFLGVYLPGPGTSVSSFRIILLV